MGTTPPESKSQPASERDEDPHESVTIAPPAPNFEDLLHRSTPVPSFSNKSDHHFRAALDAGSRAGSDLTELVKLATELSGGVVSARQANERLVQELSTLRAMLGAANEQQLGLKHRLAELEQELLAARQQAERDKQFLTEQQDEFLAGLLEEHEEALSQRFDGDDTRRMGPDVSDLTQKLVQTEAARQQAELECQRAREALAKVQAQRDEAQARAMSRERERDELRAEASRLRARLGTMRAVSTAPPPPVASRPPSFRPPALELDSGELESNLHPRPATPRLPSVRPRLTPPPAELAGAVYTPKPASVPPAPLPASVSAFPRESTRPGVGGPKLPGSVPPADFGPPPSGLTPLPPAPDLAGTRPTPAAGIAAQPAPPRPRVMSAASLPPNQVAPRPVLKQKPDPTTRPLISYSLGEDGVASELLEGARISSKPPHK